MDSVIDYLRTDAKQHGADPAFTFLGDATSDETISRAELWRRIVNASAQIQEITSAGDRVIVTYPPGFDFIVSVFGCLHAGVIVVPTYPPATNQKYDRIGSVVADCTPSLVIG